MTNGSLKSCHPGINTALPNCFKHWSMTYGRRPFQRFWIVHGAPAKVGSVHSAFLWFGLGVCCRGAHYSPRYRNQRSLWESSMWRLCLVMRTTEATDARSEYADRSSSTCSGTLIRLFVAWSVRAVVRGCHGNRRANLVAPEPKFKKVKVGQRHKNQNS